MRHRRWLIFILLLAGGLRLGWGLTRPVNDAAIDTLPDQRDYLSLASNLIHGHGLNFIDPRFDDTVYAFRTPGYPIFLAAFGANIRIARAVQALLDVSTILGIYLLARLLVPVGYGRVPLISAAILAINPFLIYFSALLLTETLYTAMLVWGMVLLVRGNGGRGGSWGATFLWLAGGVILGLSVLVRPSAIALSILLGLVAVFVNRTGAQPYEKPVVRWRLPVGATMVGILLLCLLPWALRNVRVLGHWVWLDTNSGFTLYDGYNPDATGGSDQGFVDREPELQILGEVGRSDYLAHKAEAYAQEHPARVLHLIVARLGRTWSPVPLSAEYGSVRNRLIALVYALPFDLLVIVGLLIGNLSRSAKLLLLTPAIYFSTVHGLTVGSLRYRIPAEAPMAIIAASALAAGAQRIARRDVPV
ncbi:MAG TPA: hypothetical protein VN541_00230 [Tepidisphaeraceae bacterium]|nr:hypothetical protein [Tepidisphaeraceae bacterium]